VKKLTSADIMNIIMAVIGLVGLKRAPECIKMHHFEGENAKIFLGRGPSPQPPFHISKYATAPIHWIGERSPYVSI